MIPSLARLLDEVAAELAGDLEAAAELAGDLEGAAPGPPGIRAVASDGVTSWSRNGRVFATAGPGGVEFQLERAIAAAAARTPDAGPSPRGPEWVRFNPRELDGHAADRVTAWFGLACRLAAD